MSTQIEIIKTALLEGQLVTSVTAFKNHYITRLSSIILRIRQQGWPVATARGKSNGIASYSLPEHWKPGREHSDR